MEVKVQFDSLNLQDNLLRGIYSYGFENPSFIQYTSIPKIMENKDLIAQAQSGTGKTGAFTISALQKVDPLVKQTQILIIAPTHELVHQSYNVLEELGKYMDISMERVMGGTSVSECIHNLSKDPQIIVGSPGRILDMIQKKYLFTDGIKMLVMDEADEILSFGFTDTIYSIFQYVSKETQICLFSATMPEEILSMSTNLMRNPEQILVNKDELTLEGILQFYVNVKVSDWKYDVLKDLYDTINIAQCIIYINSKQRLTQIYDQLLRDDFPVSMMHGDIHAEERKEIMKSFKEGHTRILLSTDLLSRGIDIQQLSLVINFDLPKSKETYIHRIGRSGRYGRKGVAINFVSDRDIHHMKEIESFYDTKIEEMPQNIGDYLGV